MRKSIIAGAAITATLALAGTAQADVVKSLDGQWKPSNSTVVKTPDGVHFGTYADGGAIGGSVMYSGANGRTLADVNDYSFKFNYKQAGDLTGAAPYARIFLDTNTAVDSNGDGNPKNDVDADVVLDPSRGGLVTPVQGADQTFGTADDSVRYGDDAGESAQQTWADVKSAHGSDVITNVLVSQGYSMGTDVSAMLRSVTLNGEKFDFTGAPADGTNGTNGVNGKDGTNGTDGVNGVNGKDGVTTIITEPAKVIGASMRTIHAPSVRGWKFISVRASLGGQRLHAHHRTIKVDLRNKSVGTYSVRMTAKYQDKRGKVHTLRSVRALDITRS